MEAEVYFENEIISNIEPLYIHIVCFSIALTNILTRSVYTRF